MEVRLEHNLPLWRAFTLWPTRWQHYDMINSSSGERILFGCNLDHRFTRDYSRVTIETIPEEIE